MDNKFVFLAEIDQKWIDWFEFWPSVDRKIIVEHENQTGWMIKHVNSQSEFIPGNWYLFTLWG